MAKEQENKETKQSAEQKEQKPKTDKKTTELKEKIAALENELTAQKDSYLRLCAEYDNFRKRTAKEKTEIYSNATANTVKGLLDVVDNFERALNAAGENADEGLKLIFSQFTDYLTKTGVVAMDDEFFDPNRHIAVMHIEDESYKANQIIEVLQKGYILNDKVVRLACVKVAN